VINHFVKRPAVLRRGSGTSFLPVKRKSLELHAQVIMQAFHFESIDFADMMNSKTVARFCFISAWNVFGSRNTVADLNPAYLNVNP
jgi:hypothetical protein